MANWFHEVARAHGTFAVELVDLASFALPVFDEPRHPRFQQYEKPHTRAWSAKVSRADAFVFVTPEYNFCPPPSFVNALDYLYVEWNYKPCGFVSYGGGSGGLRAVQVEKQLVTTLKMMPMAEGVAIPSVAKRFDGNGVFQPDDHLAKAAHTLLDELHRWARALAPMRAPAKS